MFHFEWFCLQNCSKYGSDSTSEGLICKISWGAGGGHAPTPLSVLRCFIYSKFVALRNYSTFVQEPPLIPSLWHYLHTGSQYWQCVVLLCGIEAVASTGNLQSAFSWCGVLSRSLESQLLVHTFGCQSNMKEGWVGEAWVRREWLYWKGVISNIWRG